MKKPNNILNQLDIKICQLCGAEPTAEKSHIISKLIYKAVDEQCGGHRKIRSTQNPSLIQQDILKTPFLGESCEDLLETYETPFSVKFRNYLQNTESTLEIDESDYRMLVSISWRIAKYMIHTESPDKAQHLIKPELAWRKYLLRLTTDISPFHQYLFLAKDFKEAEIRNSAALTVTHLNTMIGHGVQGFYGGKITKQATFANLGPLILIGQMRDLKGHDSPESEEWSKFIIVPGTTLTPAPRDLPPGFVSAIDNNFIYVTKKMEQMTDKQKANQREFADKNLQKSKINILVQKDQKLFTAKNE